jgi:hypothetical protein
VGTSRAETPYQLEPQGAAGLDEQGLVNRFMRDPHLHIVRKIDYQSRGDLLRRPAQRQAVLYLLPEPRTRN